MSNSGIDELKTELKKAINAIDELKTRLAQKEKEITEKSKLAVLGELGLGFAHEIKNPLSAITTYLDLLNNSISDESQKSILKKLRHSVLEIDIITNNMLFYTKELKAEISSIDLEALIDETIASLEVAIGRKNLKVTKQISHRVINGDYQLLKRSLVNLIANAADANQNEGSILVETITSNGQCCIAVEDTGTGILDPGKLFQPFHTTKAKGMGLGLALVKKFMQAQSGNVSLKPPKTFNGARFELTLPIKQ
ncbi:MAG: ATP-binding protein [Planctomycetes bacterium]|nr:ATP-binding protein [Planctomycetota bacterium]